MGNYPSVTLTRKAGNPSNIKSYRTYGQVCMHMYVSNFFEGAVSWLCSTKRKSNKKPNRETKKGKQKQESTKGKQEKKQKRKPNRNTKKGNQKGNPKENRKGTPKRKKQETTTETKKETKTGS